MLDAVTRFLTRYRRILLPAAFVAALAVPFLFTNRYALRLCILSLMFVVLALSLNLMVGMLGQMSFGHAAFWGIGAYTAAILSTRFGLSAAATFPAAMVVSGLFGVLLGLPVLKLKGYYFTIVTMVFCEIVRVVELNWMGLTNGPMGIVAIPKPSFFGLEIKSPEGFYFLALAMVVVTAVVIYNIMNSRIGLAVTAVRDDELAAESMGVNIFACKVMIFVVSSMFAGLAGAFYAQYTSYIDPTAFSNLQSNEMLVMVIFGGLGSMLGSFIGAISLSMVPELLRGLAEYRILIYGVLLVVLMLVRPQGLFGSVNFRHTAQRMGLRRKAVPDPAKGGKSA